MEALNFLLHNSYFVSCSMAVIIFGLTEFLKLGIKHFTNKISDETVRKRVNTVILLIPFILGVLFDFIYSTYYLQVTFLGINGLGYGAAGVSLYNVIERFFKPNAENPYNSEEGKAVTKLVEDIAQDGVIDKKDIDHVKEFWDKVK